MAQQLVLPRTLTFLSQGLEPWRNGWHSNRLFRVRLPFSVRALNHGGMDGTATGCSEYAYLSQSEP
jgi:hypothetical protein